MWRRRPRRRFRTAGRRGATIDFILKQFLFAVLLCVAAQASASCIHGTLIAEDGKPVQGAVVMLFSPESDAERAGRRETLAQRTPVNRGKSNERGWFLVDPKRRGDFDVVVVADGYGREVARKIADGMTITACR